MATVGAVAAYRYVVCDVFTDTPLAGNQLGVFTDARSIPEDTLLRLARELNFSETTFVYPPESGGHVRMRIFTPGGEVPFAGHPTLGTAFVLAAPLQLGEIRIETGRGIVPVRLERDGARIVFGRMEQPLPSVEPFAEADALLAALGVARSELPVELTTTASVTCTSLFPPRTRWRRSGRAWRASAPRLGRRQLLRGRRRPLEDAHVRARARRRRGSRRPARRPGRSRSISPGTGGSLSARRSRSRRAPRSGGPRRCTRASTGAPAPWSGSRSAAAPSSSRAASSVSRRPHRPASGRTCPESSVLAEPRRPDWRPSSQSSQATAATSGSSNGSECQKMPPLRET